MVRLIIVEDEQIIIDGLTALLSQNDLVEVVGAAKDYGSAKSLIESASPEVILMDLQFPAPSPDGIEMTSRLLRQFPQSRVLMLTSYDDLMLIKEALRKGAMGYVLKNADKKELIQAIQTVADGKRYLDNQVRDIVINALLEEGGETAHGSSRSGSHRNKREERPLPLTERELEIARLIAQGKKRKEIAEVLFISTNTVDTHLKNTFGKLEIKNAIELTKWMQKRGLLTY
ncbi:MAG: response regulator transcription factor [Bacteroidota bacterium]